jgi:hypothetical protein
MHLFWVYETMVAGNYYRKLAHKREVRMVNLWGREIKLFCYLSILFFWMVIYLLSEGGTRRQKFRGGHQHFRGNKCIYFQSKLETYKYRLSPKPRLLQKKTAKYHDSEIQNLKVSLRGLMMISMQTEL